MDEPQENSDLEDSARLGLEGSHHLPSYSIFYAWPQDQHPNVILSQDFPSGSPKIPTSGIPTILGAH